MFNLGTLDSFGYNEFFDTSSSSTKQSLTKTNDVEKVTGRNFSLVESDQNIYSCIKIQRSQEIVEYIIS